MKRVFVIVLLFITSVVLCTGLVSCTKKNTPKDVNTAIEKLSKAGYETVDLSNEYLCGFAATKGDEFIRAELCSNISQAQAACDLYKKSPDVPDGYKVGIQNLWVYYGTKDAINAFFG